jgi:hypothetical protein
MQSKNSLYLYCPFYNTRAEVPDNTLLGLFLCLRLKAALYSRAKVVMALASRVCEMDSGKGSAAILLLLSLNVHFTMKNLNFARLNAEARHINFVQVIYSNIHQAHQCFYCQTPLNKNNRTKDHLIPRTRAYSMGNIPLL